ncbi:FUSC family protein [Cognatilysobacter terrigena]|uniref:FUSC family protein n=1 Tax=Cognatilysobacter terrigena TaxID=2488749 RepID=UPI00105D38DE|nr:FUSC family protein [Lysobacter terrigena]
MSGPSHRPLQTVVRSLFQRQAPPPQRWRFSARAALCTGLPIVAGWLAHDMAAGLMASIGGYTALYGSGRPYRSRAWLLASIAFAQALAVGVGIAAGGAVWSTILSIALTATLATWLCNALQTGPPGAYIIVLACASGTAMRASHLSPLHSAALIFAGGAFAWIVQMAGGLLDPHGPERRALDTARRAVAAFIDARDGADADGARRRAALALQQAWTALVAQQPARSRGDATVGRLRTLNRELHTLFADAVAAEPESSSDALRARLDAIDRRLQHLDDVPVTPRDAVPTGRPDAMDALRDSLRPGSPLRRVVARVGLCAIAVGALATGAHLERAYWAVAAAVLMLHMGYDWTRTLQRALQRSLGTWIGLLLAAAILKLHPDGLVLALVAMALQFAIEMLVVRNYAVACIFITASALTIASSGHPDAHGSYLVARGVDTAIGCLCALVVYALIPPKPTAARLPTLVANVLDAAASVLEHIEAGDVISRAARQARARLQRSTFALAQAYEEGINGSMARRRVAEQAWPVVAAAERLAYRVLAIAWSRESAGANRPPLAAAAIAQSREAFATLAEDVRARRDIGADTQPAVLRIEFDALKQALATMPSVEGR